MPVLVIDFLESIQIQESDDQHALMSFATRESLAYSVGQQNPVRQSGQRVIVRVVLELILKTLLRADVVQCADVARVNRNQRELRPDSMPRAVNKPKQGLVSCSFRPGTLQSLGKRGAIILQDMFFKRMTHHLLERNTGQKCPRRIQENDTALPVKLENNIRHQFETSAHAPITLNEGLHQLVGGCDPNIVEKGVSCH